MTLLSEKKDLEENKPKIEFFTWKKIFVILLIAQLQYEPCENPFNSHLHSHEEITLAQATKEPFTKNKDSSRRTWSAVEKENTWENSLSKDYYLTKVKAKPSRTAEETGSNNMKMQSCYDSAKTQGIYTIFSELSLEFLKENSPNIKEGKINYENPKTHLSFSCSFSSTATSFQIQACQGYAKNYGVSSCEPINSWSACECQVYLYLPGGKKFLNHNIQIKEEKDL